MKIINHLNYIIFLHIFIFLSHSHLRLHLGKGFICLHIILLVDYNLACFDFEYHSGSRLANQINYMKFVAAFSVLVRLSFFYHYRKEDDFSVMITFLILSS